MNYWYSSIITSPTRSVEAIFMADVVLTASLPDIRGGVEASS
ncbi:hypothetical protein BN961_03077 [Afipia felis]|uniref:Uncharacterized protein n=1 Tax=Afipia felis TaxID=1035 RepID=A0A090MTU8_AFIFE|nr:hypothetical protein BN961_03077 [Afipia felis]